jgi:hypothetical protein
MLYGDVGGLRDDKKSKLGISQSSSQRTRSDYQTLQKTLDQIWTEVVDWHVFGFVKLKTGSRFDDLWFRAWRVFQPTV